MEEPPLFSLTNTLLEISNFFQQLEILDFGDTFTNKILFKQFTMPSSVELEKRRTNSL